MSPTAREFTSTECESNITLVCPGLDNGTVTTFYRHNMKSNPNKTAVGNTTLCDITTKLSVVFSVAKVHDCFRDAFIWNGSQDKKKECRCVENMACHEAGRATRLF